MHDDFRLSVLLPILNIIILKYPTDIYTTRVTLSLSTLLLRLTIRGMQGKVPQGRDDKRQDKAQSRHFYLLRLNMFLPYKPIKGQLVKPVLTYVDKTCDSEPRQDVQISLAKVPRKWYPLAVYNIFPLILLVCTKCACVSVCVCFNHKLVHTITRYSGGPDLQCCLSFCAL